MATIPETRHPVTAGERRPTREECIQAAALVLATAVREFGTPEVQEVAS
ncbi:hypothetical protein [Arthrobacter sp. JSM 101049]